jgi:hypothetical protein
MKIGILTFHYMINQGSILQAYCVYQLLKYKYPKAEVEIIDLIPKNRGDNEKNFYKKMPPFIRFDALARYRSMRRFWKNRVKFSPRSESMDLREQIRFINSQSYDAIFTGSDTVWMHSDKLNNLLPHIYFLPEGIVAKKYAIAASADPLKDKRPYFDRSAELLKALETYEAILIRDRLTYKLMEDLGVPGIQDICDPTLLYLLKIPLVFAWTKPVLWKKKKVHIHLGNKSAKRAIRALLEKTGKFEFVEFEEKSALFSGDHIVDYLNEYADIQILITDRFHRSIFAMKLSKALVINVEHFAKNPTPNSKGRDLFSKIGLPKYCVRYEKDGEEELLANILQLVDQWDEVSFQIREKNLRQFIVDNQLVWDRIR